MTDREFIEKIRTGGYVMQKTIETFYIENFNLVYHAIKKRKLKKDEALDAYSDAVTYLMENVRNNKFKGESKCSTYFIRIFNNKCVDIIRKKTTNLLDKNTITLDSIENGINHSIVENVDTLDIYTFLNKLGKICQDVLIDWCNEYTMEEIALRNGLKNANTARSKKYNCFSQLMSILRKQNIIQIKHDMEVDGI